MKSDGINDPVYRKIYELVKKIPPGKVATYGQIAGLLGIRTPRQVGYALHALPDDAEIPWHRVINHAGRISLSDMNGGASLQRTLLESEGIIFDSCGSIHLNTFIWQPFTQTDGS